MPDLVVTVPQDYWPDWLAEGDIPGQPPGGAFDRYDFTCGLVRERRPPISPGERVYVVAHGRVRGYAPLVEVAGVEGKWSLVRAGGAVACTIPELVRGFRGWQERWWPRKAERPFPAWQTEDVKLDCVHCTRKRLVGGYRRSTRLGGAQVLLDPICAWCTVEAIDNARKMDKPIGPGWLAVEAGARAIVERSHNAAEYALLDKEARR